ncbi:uncharacterized protein PHACADRAFT_261112 [Phanerochaete carnosa HHB-10118-sp]|uniref:Transmembrane protein n=1 Tax=Phanerochaete carnosa (strain HHB-10118-sp) TaxID=650164 RepID=K5W0F6_PHACS|nr:uncharacterized protein PHACADRAFT_261112 [Phanerochaete carnosa HHB-10118-sp]EKM52590.1 hypothetical protein PHACADRAFT_261112 [Phanerochaete carnosa HHB-10118-sp]
MSLRTPPILFVPFLVALCCLPFCSPTLSTESVPLTYKAVRQTSADLRAVRAFLCALFCRGATQTSILLCSVWKVRRSFRSSAQWAEQVDRILNGKSRKSRRRSENQGQWYRRAGYDDEQLALCEAGIFPGTLEDNGSPAVTFGALMRPSRRCLEAEESSASLNHFEKASNTAAGVGKRTCAAEVFLVVDVCEVSTLLNSRTFFHSTFGSIPCGVRVAGAGRISDLRKLSVSGFYSIRPSEACFLSLQ